MGATTQAPTTASGAIEFENASLTGQIDYRANGSDAFSFAPATTGSFAWRIEAPKLVVNWTERVYVVVGKPGNSSDPHSQYEKGNPTHGQETFHGVSGEATAQTPTSNLLVTPQKETRVKAVLESATLQAVQGTGWAAGRETSSEQAASRDPTSKFHALLPNQAQISSEAGKLSLNGTFSVYVWQAEILLSDGQTFQSGTWASLTPTGSASGVWEQTYRLVRIDVYNGFLRANWSDRTATWAAPEPIFEGAFTANFTRASGEFGARPTRVLRDEPFAVSGQAVLIARNESSVGRLSGELEVVEGTVAVFETLPLRPDLRDDGPGPEFSMVTPSAPPWKWSAAGLVALVLAGIGVARVEPLRPDFADVEWALLSGRNRRAQRWGRRLVRRQPRDPDALFLYGSALLARRRFGLALDAVEPLAQRIPVKSRIGIAFLLAVAARKIGDEARAARWAREAAREPSLYSQMAADDLLSKYLGLAAPDQAYA